MAYIDQEASLLFIIIQYCIRW